ncbi:MAG: hypothetical protein CVT82_13590 [Alphaproteobacteria bacterium HGW-Alphaproteobacteria-4]|jgi:hypothetical protein|nr:MAG: hypothetical protein CVT82_13590 [Alphaproteobacteria bacterium HGW-Alphaproteobacteria-4]
MAQETSQSAPMVMDHAAMMQAGVGLPTLAEDTIPQEGGQAAFAAIAEIVARLVADPATDWTKVDGEALRQHLIDMDNVTLHAEVSATEIEGGARFDVSAVDPVVQASIRRMALAHVATMNGYLGLSLSAEPTERGAVLTATGSAAQVPMLRGLGFIGVLSLGAHHQTHHLALATGQNPH